MKCSQFRIALLTFVLGVISVSFVGGFYDKWSQPFVELPQAESDAPIIVDIYPTKRFPMQYGGGGGSGYYCQYSECATEKSVGRYINEVPTNASLKTCCRIMRKR